MASFINEFQYTINTGTTYIFRGYIYNDSLSKIQVLNTEYLPISDEEQNSYILSPDEANDIYNGIMKRCI